MVRQIEDVHREIDRLRLIAPAGAEELSQYAHALADELAEACGKLRVLTARLDLVYDALGVPELDRVLP